MGIGIDIGSAAVRIVVIENGIIVCRYEKKHHGRWKEETANAISMIISEHPEYESYPVFLTGVFAKAFRNEDCGVIEMIPAIQNGIHMVLPEAATIISIGSQSSIYMTGLSDSRPPLFAMNDHCAGGTGSFFEGQMPRLSMKIEDYSALADKACSIPRLSGRCAVFAKTDIIHRQQEGVSVPDILQGLCYAAVRNFKAAIVRNLPVERPVALIGGVSANSGVVKAVKDVFSLSDDELFIPDDALFIPAIGAAREADRVEGINLQTLLFRLKRIDLKGKEGMLPRLPYRERSDDPEHTSKMPDNGCFLGIDAGSTSTDLVLMADNGKIIDYLYLRTGSSAYDAVEKGLGIFRERYGDFRVIASCVTGSGRERVSRLFHADTTVDEITAQAKAAVAVYPDCDTVFEIGGQDSKYISIDGGKPAMFRMNRVCAAGTGSFVEEIAERLGVSINDFGKVAFDSECPVDLGERCTVFMSNAAFSALSEGASISDVAAGVCSSIVRNYLRKVVGDGRIGNFIVLQGGVGYNPAIVSAFEMVVGTNIHLSPIFPISGAYGAALIASQKKSSIQADSIERNMEFIHRPSEYLLEGYDGVIDRRKKVIGIPYALMIHKFFPMANAFFRALGFSVLLSSPTNENTIKLSQENAEAETCYPVKLLYGHMKELMDKKADYIFMPSIRTLKHEKSGIKHNYGCVYMQTAPRMIADSLRIEEEGIKLLNPLFDLDFGKEAMVSAMLETAKNLGIPKPLAMPALLKGAMAVRRHTARTEEEGRKLLSLIKQDEKVIVIIAHNYDISDKVLNMGIPELFAKRGYKVMTLSHLEAHDIDLSGEYPGLYWPFGQHIISGAKIVRDNPNLFAVYLTNHGCGPDTMLRYLFRHEMKGKPYLEIETDEHFSPIGVITRIEAFLNSIDNYTGQTEKPEKLSLISSIPDKENGTLVIPRLGAYSRYLAMYFESVYGVDADEVPITEGIIAAGRSRMESKEYSDFAVIMGLMNSMNHDRCQLLVPASEGADADGVYPEVLNAIAFDENMHDISIISPLLEGIFEQAVDPKLLALALAAGDLEMILHKKLFDHIPTLAELEDTASDITQVPQGKYIDIIGTPVSIFCMMDYLRSIISSGYALRPMPLSEYLAFLSSDSGYDAGGMKKIIKHLDDILGDVSPYEVFENLATAADTVLPRFAGGNGRYRAAKILLSASDAVISVSPRYENTETVLEIKHVKGKSPIFHLAFGENDDEDISRLRSFLYYLE